MKRLAKRLKALSQKGPIWISDSAKSVLTDESALDIDFSASQISAAVLVVNETEEVDKTSDQKIVRLLSFASTLQAMKQNAVHGVVVEKGWKSGFLEEGRVLFEKSWWILYALFVFFMLGKQIIPSDDLLRHIVSYRYGLDYNNAYLYGFLPQGTFYLTFDWLVGLIHKFTIGTESNNPLPLVIVSCSIGLLLLESFRKNLTELKPVLQLIGICALLFLIEARVYFGRPTTLMTGLFLLALVNPENSKAWIRHLLVGSALAVSYWLSWIYLIPLTIWRKTFAIPLLAGIGYWYWAMDGTYFETIVQLMANLTDPNLRISETENIFLYAGFTLMALLVFACLCAVKDLDLKSFRPKNVIVSVWGHFQKSPAFYLAIYFLLPLQFRYIEIIAPLLLISLAQFYAQKAKRIQIPDVWIFVCALLLFVSATDLIMQQMEKGQEYLPSEITTTALENKRVLTLQRHMFPLLYSVSGIKIAPSMNMMWAEQGVKDLLWDLGRHGKVDCQKIAPFDFDYVVETEQLRMNLPHQCLDLYATDGRFRLWRVASSAEH